MNKTKIEWTDYTWNPITGCKTGCGYCYGRRIRKRFHPDAPWDEIMYFDERLDEPIKLKKPSRIFVCSMSDLFGKWISGAFREYIFDTIRRCPQHTFQFLTKYPLRYCDFAFPGNCWIGITHTGETPEGYIYDGKMDSKVIIAFEKHKNTFLSCEPLLGDSISIPTSCKWVIIGAMTGPRSESYQPRIEWIENILSQAIKLNIPVFMKNSLKKVWKSGLRQEFPECGD